MKALLTAATAATLALLTALPAQAQFAKAEDAIKYRKSALFIMSQHWGRLGAMATGRVPFDAKVAAENADALAVVSKLPWTAFGPGTDKGDTRAKPEIWSEADKFKAALDKNQAEMVKTIAAAKTGNLDALKASFSAAAPTCKACHDNFRKD